MEELRKGRSTVIESEHSLILGWNPQRVIEIIRELVMANESEEKPAVVILADEDKEKMDDFLKPRPTRHSKHPHHHPLRLHLQSLQPPHGRRRVLPLRHRARLRIRER